MKMNGKFVLIAGVLVAGAAGALRQDRSYWDGYCDPRPDALCPDSLRTLPKDGGRLPPQGRPTNVASATAGAVTADIFENVAIGESVVPVLGR